MPTTATNTWSYTAIRPMYEPDEECLIAVNLPVSVSYTAGTLLGEVTATPGTAKAYVDAAGDGSGVAKYVLPYDCATDASGNITIGSTTAGVNAWGVTSKSVAVYHRGTFKTSELKQAGAGSIDAAAVADLYAHLISGTLADGVIRIP